MELSAYLLEPLREDEAHRGWKDAVFGEKRVHVFDGAAGVS
jgi:hypothetical protein